MFTEEEVHAVIMDLPNDKAPSLDGFTGLFYKKTWEIIKVDIMNAFNAFWSQDSRSFNHLNDAYMILLKKKEHSVEIHDYRPISLIHSFGKLVTKCLARHLGYWMCSCCTTNVHSLRAGEYMPTSGKYSLLAKSCTTESSQRSC
jgi:hypothetical protein